MTLPRIARVECDGFDFSVFATNDFVSQHIFRHGTWARMLVSISEVLLKGFEAPVVIDAGANIGLYTVPVASLIAPRGGRVVAFEAQRIVFQQLCANVFANRLDCVWANHQALGSVPGEAEIPSFDYAKTSNIGAFSLKPELQRRRGLEAGEDRSRPERVAVTTLDALELPGQVRLIKIDVEGMEAEVIRGGRRLLEDNGFPPVLFEAWGSDWYAAEKAALFAEIAALGYAITNLAGDEYLAQHPRHDAQIEVTTQDKAMAVKRIR